MLHTAATQDITRSWLRLLEYKSIDMEARQLRCNLTFSGLTEVDHDDCLRIVTELIRTRLRMDTKTMNITSAYRSENANRAHEHVNPRNRSIFVTFSDADNNLFSKMHHFIQAKAR
jgi:hypothetical protein